MAKLNRLLQVCLFLNIFQVNAFYHICSFKDRRLCNVSKALFLKGEESCENCVDGNENTVLYGKETSSPRTLKFKIDRRSILRVAASNLLLPFVLNPRVVYAGIDPNALKKLSVEGDNSGVQTRLRQIEVNKNRPEDALDIPFDTLPSGVSVREFREGKGEAVVQKGSKVAVEMTIRCKSFATNNEPGGVKYFTTKQDTEFNELAFTVGEGEVPSGLEDGMMGMHKGGLRRIEVPSTLVFAARDSNQLPLPTTKDGQRIFQRLFKTDATLLFEVLITRLK